MEWEFKRKEAGDFSSAVNEVALVHESLAATDGAGFVTPASGISTPNGANLS